MRKRIAIYGATEEALQLIPLLEENPEVEIASVFDPDVEKVRARQHWSALTYHHFVRLEAICSGRVVYLDPWRTGDPDNWEAADFPFPDGNGWAHTTTHTHEAGDSPRDPGND